MCGIVGVAGNTNQMVMKAFRDMHLFDVVRGIDSSGIVSVPIAQHGKVEMYKELGGPTNLWEYDEVNFDARGVLKGNPKVVIGHNRAATMGDVNAENAHPFNYGDIYGAHNGTLHDWLDLDPENQFKIDSQALLNSINEKGVHETWKSFRGAAAIVYWDNKRERLCMARNGERPMYICENSAKDVMFFASEPWMIRQAAARNKITLSDEDGHSMRYLAIDTHYEFIVTATTVKMVEVTALEKKLYQAPVYNSGANGSGGAVAHYKNRAGFTNLSRKKSASSRKLNEYWAKGTVVSTKDTNNLSFKVTLAYSSGYFQGKFLTSGWEDKPLIIVPKSEEDVNRLTDLIGTTHVLRSTARMREMECGSNENPIYRCSMDHVEELVMPLVNSPKTMKADELAFKYKDHSGNYVTLLRWKELTKNPTNNNCDCAWCGDPLNPDDHAELRWLTKHHAGNDVLCPLCAKDSEVNQQMNLYIGV
jgi:predicted glutamine amidotransferase